MDEWRNLEYLEPKTWRCGHCDKEATSRYAYRQMSANQNYTTATIYICACGRPTYFGSGGQVPGPRHGREVRDLPSDVRTLYDEARAAFAVRAFTAAVLALRKIIMHVSVEKGAPSNASFVAYVDHLTSKGYVPPDARPWVDHIRKTGNEANHELVLADQSKAEEMLELTELLLIHLYEFPIRMSRRTPTP